MVYLSRLCIGGLGLRHHVERDKKDYLSNIKVVILFFVTLDFQYIFMW